ncbi:dethiobiotin synthase [soil metagenome]
MSMEKYFVTAIGTDSGKTLASAILAHAFGADYWKPVQAGFPKDSDTVQNLLNDKLIIHPESYVFKTPASPHAAAKMEDITISINKIKLPDHKNPLIIEGAGGLMVPLNNQDLMIDLIYKLEAPVILIVNLYLGCINHSLLSLEALRQRKIPLKGIIFNGAPNKETEEIILKKSESQLLLHIYPEPEINLSIIGKYARQLNKTWQL